MRRQKQLRPLKPAEELWLVLFDVCVTLGTVTKLQNFICPQDGSANYFSLTIIGMQLPGGTGRCSPEGESYTQLNWGHSYKAHRHQEGGGTIYKQKPGKDSIKLGEMRQLGRRV